MFLLRLLGLHHFPNMQILTTLIYQPEFIHLISSEANEICEGESKKTIAPEHIIGALNVSSMYSLCFKV
jgi:hypothetical protein